MRLLLALLWLWGLGLGFLPDSVAQESLAEDVAFFAQGLRPQFADDLLNYAPIPLYRVQLRLSPSASETLISGHISIRYPNQTGAHLSELLLRLYPNLPSFGGSARIEALTVNGQALSPQYDDEGSLVVLPLAEALAPGAEALLDFDYHVEVQHGEAQLYNQFSYLESDLALASFLPLFAVYEDGEGWARNTDHQIGDAVYSAVANFDVNLTVPDYLSIIPSGTLVESLPSDDPAWRSYRYAAPLMRDFSLMASPNYQRLQGQHEDVLVNVYYLPGQQQGARSVLQWAIEALAAFEERFGDYAYQELDVVETHTSAAGIEYPGLIVLADDLWAANDQSLRAVTAHEVAHQWWYSMVGNDQPRYPWLDEALTDFSTVYYYEYAQGQGGYSAVLDLFASQYAAYQQANGDRVIGDPASSYAPSEYSAVVYRRGTLFFHELRQVLGDEAFFSALQQYFRQHRYGIASPDDLQAAFEAAHGSDLDALFLNWVGYSN